jgi:hypothetical protein
MRPKRLHVGTYAWHTRLPPQASSARHSTTQKRKAGCGRAAQDMHCFDLDQVCTEDGTCTLSYCRAGSLPHPVTKHMHDLQHRKLCVMHDS